MFQTNIVEKIKHTLCVQKHFPVNRDVYETMWGKNGAAGQSVGDNIIWRMSNAC